jgi:hypothetical protein
MVHLVQCGFPGSIRAPKGARQIAAAFSTKSWPPNRALDAARRELASRSIRTDERNYQKALERLQPCKDKVQLHERNIEALRREISNLR